MPQWMIVYTTYNAPEAYIVAGRLESEGIQAMVHLVPGASALGIHVGRLGEVSVLVRMEDHPLAMAILEPDEPGALPDSTEDVRYLGIEDEDDE